MKPRRSPLRPPSKPAPTHTPALRGDRESGARHKRNVPAEAPVRLQKALADAGIGSRRDMEAWIAEGRVTVNGETAKLGDRVTSQDIIKLSGRRVYLRPVEEKRVRVLMYHKQEGEIVSRDDPKGRASVFEQLPKIRGAKWVSVGRLDYNTEGLMLFTTSGDLANRLMHPRFEVEREYAVRVLGELTGEMQQQLLQGVELDDGEARVERLEEAGGEGVNRWWRVMLREGRYREVRRLFEAVGVKVSRLIRTRYGVVSLPPQLKRGQKHELDEAGVRQLLKWAGMDTPRRAMGRRDMEQEQEDSPPRRERAAYPPPESASPSRRATSQDRTERRPARQDSQAPRTDRRAASKESKPADTGPAQSKSTRTKSTQTKFAQAKPEAAASQARPRRRTPR